MCCCALHATPRRGYVSRQRVGRRNSYALVPDLPLRHPLERQCAVGTLLSALGTRPARQDPTPGS